MGSEFRRGDGEIYRPMTRRPGRWPLVMALHVDVDIWLCSPLALLNALSDRSDGQIWNLIEMPKYSPTVPSGRFHSCNQSSRIDVMNF